MKPINIIVGIGALAVASLGGWYMYMQSQPLYQKAAQRGLDPALFPPTAASSAPAPVEPSAAPTAAPTAGSTSTAPATTAP